MHGAQAALLEPLFHAQIEIRCVDADEHIRLPVEHALAEFLAQLQQARQMTQDFGQAHQCQLAGIEPGFTTGVAHRIAADACELGIRVAFAQGTDQTGAQPIAGRFTRDQCDTDFAAGNGGRGIGKGRKLRCRQRIPCSRFRGPADAPAAHRCSGRSALSMKSSSCLTSSLSCACSANCCLASASGRPAT
ncbi:hypothetical protein D3C81_1242680 [compost metagenome]